MAFGVRINPLVKRTLTAAQIFQIIFGASYAFLHLFVAYEAPGYPPFKISKGISTAVPDAFSAASSAIDTPAGEFRNVLKKAVLRAAGQEGLAANVRNADGQTFGLDAIHAADYARAQEEIVYRLTRTRSHCLDTSGEVFAIILNLVYLVPLAYLFVTFFARYFDKSGKRDLQHTKDSVNSAARDLASEIADAIDGHQGGATRAPPGLEDDIRNAGADAQTSLSNLRAKAAIKTEEISGKVKDDLEKLGAKSKEGAKNAKQSSSKSFKPASNADTTDHGEGTGEKIKIKPEGSGKADLGDPNAFEVNPDQLLNKEEKQAERKMQNGT